jgi:hypothetical protein
MRYNQADMNWCVNSEGPSGGLSGQNWFQTGFDHWCEV